MKSKWHEYVLSDLGEIKTGKTPPSSVKDAFGGHIPFVTPKDMTGSKWVNATERSLSGLGLQTVKNYRVPPRSVAVSCIGSDMGKVVLVAKESVTNQQINTIVVNEKLFNAEYIYYELSQRQEELKSIAGGSATPILNKGHFSNISIRLPDKQTQDVIVDVLRSLDDKIDLNRQTNQTLEQIAQAIFKSWFVDFDPVRAKIAAREAFIQQHPKVTEEAIRAAAGTEGDTLAHAGAKACELAAICAISGKTEDQLNELDDETLKQLKAAAALFPDTLVESEASVIPEGWNEIALYDTAEYINGGAFKASDFSSDGSGLPIIKIAELKQGIYGGTKYTNKEVNEKHLIKNDDVLYSWSGSPETSLEVFKWFGGKGWLNQHIFKLNFESEQQKCFTYFMLKHMKPVLIATAQQKQTTGLGHVTVADMKRIKVTYPDENLLRGFKQYISPLYEKGSICEKENICLVELRDTLLPYLLSGRYDARDGVSV